MASMLYHVCLSVQNWQLLLHIVVLRPFPPETGLFWAIMSHFEAFWGYLGVIWGNFGRGIVTARVCPPRPNSIIRGGKIVVSNIARTPLARRYPPFRAR